MNHSNDNTATGRVDKARRLLALYYDGMTSAEQTAWLSEFFRSGDVPAEMRDDARVFLAVESGAGQSLPELPAGMESRLDALVDSLAARETRRRSPLKSWKAVSIAASVAVLVAVGVAVLGRQPLTGDPGDELTADVVLYDDEVTDPDRAAEIAVNALAHLSSRMKNGIDEVSAVEEEIESVSKQINYLKTR